MVEVLANADGRLGAGTQRYLRPDEVVGVIVERLRNAPGWPQTPQWQPAAPTPGAPCVLLDNPQHVEGRPAGYDLETHWLPKAHGGFGADEWYFAGRERALETLVAWLEGEGDERIRVVTGSAGVGKSTLLGRLVALSDPEQRAAMQASGAIDGVPRSTRIQPGTVDVAVHARRQMLDDVTRTIGAVLDLPESSGTNALLRRLAAREEPFVVVVDAVDEGEEPARLGRQLLRPLGAIDGVRLLVGMRPEGESATRRVEILGPDTIEIDLDDPAWIGPDDVRDCVTRALLATPEPTRETPYQDDPGRARSVANVVAARAGPSFLVARIVTRTLLSYEKPVAVDDPRLQELPDEVDLAFQSYLSGFDRPGGDLSEQLVVDALLPLAYAEGTGLPRALLWAPVATALAGREVLDGDLREVLRHAAAFVIEDNDEGRSTYRLFHQAFAEYLRARVDSVDAQRRIAKSLCRLVGDTWECADPYVRKHLAAHARAGRVLDGLVADPRYLIAAEPRYLLRQLGGLGSARTAGYTYARIAHRLKNAGTGERAAYLTLAAAQDCDDEARERAASAAPALPWTARWAHWSRLGPHRVLGPTHAAGPREAVTDATIFEHEGVEYVAVTTRANDDYVRSPRGAVRLYTTDDAELVADRTIDTALPKSVAAGCLAAGFGLAIGVSNGTVLQLSVPELEPMAPQLVVANPDDSFGPWWILVTTGGPPRIITTTITTSEGISGARIEAWDPAVSSTCRAWTVFEPWADSPPKLLAADEPILFLRRSQRAIRVGSGRELEWMPADRWRARGLMAEGETLQEVTGGDVDQLVGFD